MGGTINILPQPMFWKNFPKPSNGLKIFERGNQSQGGIFELGLRG